MKGVQALITKIKGDTDRVITDYDKAISLDSRRMENT